MELSKMSVVEIENLKNDILSKSDDQAIEFLLSLLDSNYTLSEDFGETQSEENLAVENFMKEPRFAKFWENRKKVNEFLY